ncbi:MAG: hypothetical protein GY828_03485, partial [Candidatus Gracilibacteria bacterium]|nr:hypothetical protein [Candidatus Gracilibacteria bacterium]
QNTYKKEEEFSDEPELLNAHLLDGFMEEKNDRSEDVSKKYSKDNNSTTFSSGKSIWDDYESVVPELNNKKNKGK